MSKHRTILPLTFLLVLAMAFATPAHAAKQVSALFPADGASSGEGGHFSSPGDLVVNQADPADPHDGWLYVLDVNANRIQAFDSNHEFQFAIGRDVIKPGGAGNIPANSVRTITIDATGGFFRLYYAALTEPIPYDASAGTVQAALEALPKVGAGDLVVSGPPGGPWEIEFAGALADQVGTSLTISASDDELTGGAASLTSVETGHGPGVEVCTVAADCKVGVAGALGGEFDKPIGIDINQSTGNLFISETGRVQELEADGSFVQAFGADVALPGGGTAFEVCSVSAECKDGVAKTTSPGGGIGGGIAVMPPTGPPAVAGHLFVGGSQRISEYDPDPDGNPATDDAAFLRAWGWDINPADESVGFEICTIATDCKAAGESAFPLHGRFGTPPNSIAADSRGIVYAADESGSFGREYRVARFDATKTVATGANGLLLQNLEFGTGDTGRANGAEVIEVDPDGDGAGGADIDRLYTKPKAGDRIDEYDATPEPPTTADRVDMHVAGAGLNPKGIAVDPSLGAGTGTIYFSAGSRVYLADDHGAPGVAAASVDEPSDVTETEATFTGTANPGGFPATYKFQYSSDGGDTWTDAAPAQDLGSGSSDVPVGPLTVTGLASGTAFQVRLLVTREFGNGTVASTPKTFTTKTRTPSVTTVIPQNVGDDFALLGARINPNGSDTSYLFEYGETTQYGQATEVTAAGSGTNERYVLARIDGLQPDTTYHYRVTAESVEGKVEGDDIAFTTRAHAAEPLPERAYEQVTPINKQGEDVNRLVGGEPTQAVYPTSRNGEATIFSARRSLADMRWGGIDLEQPYRARRNPQGDGWTTNALAPPAYEGQKIRGFDFQQVGRVQVASAVGPLLERTLLDAGWPSQFTPEPAYGGLYLRDDAWPDPVLIAPGRLTNPTGSDGTLPDEMLTVDGHHVVFRYDDVLVSMPGIPPKGVGKVYEWADGNLRLVSVQPDGVPFSTHAATGERGGGANIQSRDGKHAFFSAPLGVGLSAIRPDTKIYRRSNGTTTTLVSPSQASTPDGAGEKAKLYLSATPNQGADDPAMVFFRSAEQLTDDANTGPTRSGSDLYRFDINSGTLIDISAETNTTNGARVEGLIGHSDDGRWVYYVARGQIVPGQGTPGAPNVWLWHDDGSPGGETRFIATLANFDCVVKGAGGRPEGDGCNYALDLGQRTARVSADGKTMLFQSEAPLTGADHNGSTQVYQYEAQENDGAGRLSCVSCNPTGAAAAGNSWLPTTRGGPADGDLARFLSNDGKRVFFNSSDALVADDVNGAPDVYEWHNGEINLVSSGRGEFGSVLSGIGASGRDVFFTTRERLVGQDEDGLIDVYDARAGGGIPEQNPLPPGVPCVGGECKPPAATAPEPAPNGTDGVQGSGNYISSFALARIKSTKLRSSGRPGRIEVVVVVRQPGRVVVRAVKGRQVLGMGSRVFSEAGRGVLTVRLNPAAKRTLGRRGSLRVRIEARFAGETLTRTIALRGAKPKARKRATTTRRSR